MTKYTKSHIEDMLNSEGYILHSLRSSRRGRMLDSTCPAGHEYSISLSHWIRGTRCSTCSGRAQFTEEEVKDALHREGYTLNSPYQNQKQPLITICPAGHEYRVSMHDWKTGKRCPRCEGKVVLTDADVRSMLSEEGYTLKSTYQGTKKPFNTICPNGHEYKTWMQYWKKGKRCSKCSGRAPLTKDEVRQLLGKEGYSLASDYKNRTTEILTKCPNGHDYATTISRWQKGVRCSKCSGRYTFTEEDVKRDLNKYGYELKSKYIDNQTKIIILCPEGHIYQTLYQYFRSGSRCLACRNYAPKRYALKCYVSKRTQEEVDTILRDLGLNLLSEYQGSNVPVEFTCTCGGVGKATLRDIRRGQRCNNCVGQRRKASRIKGKLKKMEELYGGHEDGE